MENLINCTIISTYKYKYKHKFAASGVKIFLETRYYKAFPRARSIFKFCGMEIYYTIIPNFTVSEEQIFITEAVNYRF